MADLLTHKTRVPRTPDSGAEVFPALEFDLEKMDRHIHNGLEAAKLQIPAIQVLTQQITVAAITESPLTWVVAGNGQFTQDVDLQLAINTITDPENGPATLSTALTETPLTDDSPPGDMTFDTIAIQFRLLSTGEMVYPKVVKLTSKTYQVTVNDNTIDLIAIYTT